MAQASLASAPDQALHAALVSVNAALHGAPIDDSLSGTTACCAVLQGRSLYVANVGDSRAVLAVRSEGGDLAAKDLSQDQTPFRWVGAGVGAGGDETGCYKWACLGGLTMPAPLAPATLQAGRMLPRDQGGGAGADAGPAGGAERPRPAMLDQRGQLRRRPTAPLVPRRHVPWHRLHPQHRRRGWV